MNKLLTAAEAREFLWARVPLETQILVSEDFIVTSRFFTHDWARSHWTRASDGLFDQRELVELAWRVRITGAWDAALKSSVWSVTAFYRPILAMLHEGEP